MPAAAAIVAISAATALVQNNQQKQARKDANRIQNEAQAAAQRQQDIFTNQQNQVKSNQVRDFARDRQRKAVLGAAGRSSTILTSPTGIAAPAATATKTLLGM